VQVIKPDIGEVVPGRVTCSFQIDLSQYQGHIRDEWESLHQHDGEMIIDRVTLTDIFAFLL
jgi:hypothetical protein